jgi:hypothetical protein
VPLLRAAAAPTSGGTRRTCDLRVAQALAANELTQPLIEHRETAGQRNSHSNGGSSKRLLGS